MIKAALRCIFLLAVIIIAGSVVFGSAAKICADIYEPDPGDVFEYGELPSEIYSLVDGRVMVTGKYTEGAKAGFEYFKIYNKAGICESSGNFSVQGATLELSQAVFTKDSIIFPAAATLRNGSGTFVTAFIMGYDGTLKKTLEFNAVDEDGNVIEGLEGGFRRIVCADREEGKVFVAINGSKMAFFDENGKYIFNILPEFVAEIRDVIKYEDGYIAVGCDSNNSLGRVFHSVYCAFYDENGEPVREVKYLEEDGISAVGLRIVRNGEKFLIYGKYFENEDGASDWRSVSDIDTIFAFDGSFRFHIGEEDSESDVSFFFTEIDKDGNDGMNVRYTPEGTDVLPYLASFISKDGKTMPVLVSYAANDTKADTYELTYTIPDFEKERSSTRTYTVPSDSYILCAADSESSGVYLYSWIKDSGQYSMTYYTSGAKASSALKKMMQMTPVRDKLTELKPMFPFFICMYFMMTFCIIGAARGNKRR